MLLLHRAFALGAPRRTCASSITSSWYSVARCTSSMTAPATVTCHASGSGPSCADSTVNSGRNRLPPAWNRCWTASDISSSALPSSVAIRSSMRATPSRTSCAKTGSPKSTPATTLAGVLTLPTYWETWIHEPTWSSSAPDPPARRRPRGRARAGRDVLVIDSAQFPRDKACGDGLTPRAVAELQRLGLGPWLEGRIAAPRAAAVGVRRRRRSRVAGPVVPVGQQRGAAHRARRPHPDGGRRRRRQDAAGCESR